MTQHNPRTHWAQRAPTYNRLKWVANRRLLAQLVSYADLQPHHTVLDAGTGTGVVALGMAPHVRAVYGIDFCPEMLRRANLNSHQNVVFQVGDIRSIPFGSNTFDRVTARNVFHNILPEEDRVQAARECQRVLVPGGKFILSEGIPRVEELKEEFASIFALKEERIVFTSGDLSGLLRAAGFGQVEAHEEADPDFDVNNWLDNDGTLSEDRKQRIINLHTQGSQLFQRIYNVRSMDGRVLIDTTAAYVIGTK